VDCTRGGLAGATRGRGPGHPIVAHATDAGWSLLYVGVVPRSSTVSNDKGVDRTG